MTHPVTDNLQVQSESLEACATLWARSKESLPWPGPFVSPPWLAAWWSHFGAGRSPYLLSIRNHGAFVGLAPLMREGAEAHLMGEADVCDHLDCVVAPQWAGLFYDRLLDHLVGDGIRRLVLDPVRADASVMVHLAPMAEKAGLRIRCTPEDALFAMPLPERWEDYLMALSGKERHETRRKLRRLNEAGSVALRCIRTPRELPRALDIFLALFRANRDDKAAFMSDPMAAFFKDLSANLAAEDLLRLYLLELDGRAIAATLCLDDGATVYLYNNGYDERFRKLSPGLMVKILSIREAIRNGRRCYDFLKGAEPYKKRLGGQPVKVLRCVIDVVS